MNDCLKNRTKRRQNAGINDGSRGREFPDKVEALFGRLDGDSLPSDDNEDSTYESIPTETSNDVVKKRKRGKWTTLYLI